jgi:predicted RNase H-like HicB family nuclease
MGVKAQHIPLSVSSIPTDTLQQALTQMKQAIEHSVQQLPSHQNFINKHCKAQAKN